MLAEGRCRWSTKATPALGAHAFSTRSVAGAASTRTLGGFASRRSSRWCQTPAEKLAEAELTATQESMETMKEQVKQLRRCANRALQEIEDHNSVPSSKRSVMQALEVDLKAAATALVQVTNEIRYWYGAHLTLPVTNRDYDASQRLKCRMLNASERIEQLRNKRRDPRMLLSDLSLRRPLRRLSSRHAVLTKNNSSASIS